jgi:hypothetical protein
MHFLGRPIYSGGFMPHRYGYSRSPGLIAFDAVSGSLVALTRVPIPIALPHFTLQRKAITFRWLFSRFGGFVAASPALAFRWEKRP